MSLAPDDIDRLLQLMQVAGWTMMEPSMGGRYRRYHLTGAGAAQASALAPPPADPIVELPA